ncbi:hypothetical protein DERF_010243 [Dermatophagoides farinae]|uniref:Uncharacterized protein n=1 Tax=Dermatophagoides farinae TaxID=6954 RepID=A0A922I0W1_DERFA|nr:hypothetical protein DERF_010243 [Dermatophagoides farinae]
MCKIGVGSSIPNFFFVIFAITLSILLLFDYMDWIFISYSIDIHDGMYSWQTTTTPPTFSR